MSRYQILFYNHEQGKILRYKDCPGSDPWNALLARLLVEWSSGTSTGRWTVDGVARELLSENADFQWAVLVLDQHGLTEIPLVSPAQQLDSLERTAAKLKKAIAELGHVSVLEDPAIKSLGTYPEISATTVQRGLLSLREYYDGCLPAIETQQQELVAYLKRIDSSKKHLIGDLPSAEQEAAVEEWKRFLTAAGYYIDDDGQVQLPE